MRLFRDKYTDPKTGIQRSAKKWTVEFSHAGERRRLAAFADKSASEQLGRRIERLSDLCQAGESPDPALAAWLIGLPASIRSRLAAIGLLDERAISLSRPICRADDTNTGPPSLLDDYEATLKTRGATSQHITQTVGRARAVLVGCGFLYWNEIDAGKVERYLAGRRKGSANSPAISIKTSNYLLQSVRQFCGWMVSSGLATEDPLRVLKPLNARTDVRVVRRALSTDELRRLLKAAAEGPEREGMSGPERALLYRLAVETGLRRAELMSLRTSSFQLSSEKPVVRLLAAYSKRRREDHLPIRTELADAFKAFLEGRQPNAKAFTMPKNWDAATMLREDLVAAGVLGVDEHGIVTTDDEGRVVDFHALRHTFITNLVRGGVQPKVAQALARHSTITLTLDRYTHLQSDDELNALNQLPDLDAPPQNEEQEDGRDRDPRVAHGT